MAERAGLFEDAEDFDVSAFTPKKAGKTAEPASEAIRAVSEGANFQSRDPVKPDAAKVVKATQRRRRTGRNLQLNLKVGAKTLESFYNIADRQGWVLGETLERAIEALQRELAAQK
jgi:hypothetical protein